MMRRRCTMLRHENFLRPWIMRMRSSTLPIHIKYPKYSFLGVSFDPNPFCWRVRPRHSSAGSIHVRGFSVDRHQPVEPQSRSHPVPPPTTSPTTTSSTSSPTSSPPSPTLSNVKEEEDEKSFWNQLQTPPNIITVTRMASTPILAYWVISEQYWWAIGGCTLAAISDYLDGYLAKKYGWSTVLGTYLDPLADKAFVNTLGIGLWYTGVLPTPLVVLWATKDVMLLSGTAWILYKKHGSVSILTNSVSQEPLKVTPSVIAKVNTTLQFATLVVGLMSTVVPATVLPPIVLNGLIWTTGGTTVGTVLSYGARSGMDGGSTRSRHGHHGTDRDASS